MGKLTVLGLAGVVVCLLASEAPGDAKSDYQAIFGREAGRVAVSRDKADDVAFAKKLIESAASVSESPKLQLLLYKRAYEFAARSPEGLATALEALALLAKRLPARKADWQAKRLALLRTQYMRTRGEAKKAAGQTYMEALLAAGDALMAAGRADKALSYYRSARSIAASYRLAALPEISWKIVQATDAVVLASKTRALRSRLATHPDDTGARESLILLHVVQQDAPAKAREVLTDGVSAVLRTNVPLAERGLWKLAEADCLRLAEWYHKTLLAKATGRGRRIVLERAQGYYHRYLAGHTRQDVPRYNAAEALKKVQAELLRLGPEPGQTLTAPVPIDAVAFQNHHYKAVAMKSTTWPDAVKECKKLGGHLATIESAGEMAFLRKLAGSGRLWVGATDQTVEGKWVWVNGKSMSRAFRMWASGEPNEGRAGNYASVLSDGLRDTSSQHRVTGFVCEWDG